MILKLLTALIIILIWGDALSTYLILTQVPDGRELNPFVIPFINWLGIAPAMILSGWFRTAMSLWMYYNATLGEARKFIIALAFSFALTLMIFVNVNNWLIWMRFGV